ncbi:retropepsin-like aspartic protease, partial [Klebsiella pneumoniae]
MLNSKRVHVLIDTGATLSIIPSNMVVDLGLTGTSLKYVHLIKTADSEILLGDKIVKDCVLKFGNITESIDLLILDIPWK